MRIPIEWLRAYCAPELTTAALAERLAMTGTEVERVEHHGAANLDAFVVGRVLSAEQHPNADRLKVCTVDVGGAEPARIVCGAPNVAAGQTVAVARPGAIMPDGTRLKAAKLRGEPSEGMILAEDEVGIGTDHDGIMVLDRDGLVPGAPLAAVLPIGTDVLELEITPNRPDCLAVYGVAREVHAATGAPLASPPWEHDPVSPAGVADVAGVRISVDCPELCPRFTARVFEDVTIGPSPRWLTARLLAAGQRPISNVVDITNYVMLLTGQPLHAFDLDRVAGNQLAVRRAGEGETVQTLDGQTRALDAQMVLIADAQGPTSIAGVMGGARSEVEASTTRVLMEAATWDGANIHRTSLALGLRSEASGRFEKQLQPEQAMQAQAVSTQLMLELCGARVAPGTIDLGGPGPAPVTIRLRETRVRRLLGVDIPRERQAETLTALEFGLAEAHDGLDVSVPAFRRADVTREADLIEEIARLGALDILPSTLPATRSAVGRLTPVQRLRRRAADTLTGQGLHEIVGWSFTSAELAQHLGISDRPAVALANPMSAEQAQLRTTLLGSLLDVARRNHSRGATRLALFEAGAVYRPRPGESRPDEPFHLAVLLAGPVRLATWRDANPPAADFYAAKGVLTGLLGALRVPWELDRAHPEPFLHPGRAARILLSGEPGGWIGEIHPEVAVHWDRGEPTVAFELDLDAAAALVPATVYSDLTSFPEVREDLAVIVADSVSAAQVTAVVLGAGRPLLHAAEVFDVYRDPERVGAGNVSFALRLRFRAGDRTLTDEEVAGRRRAIAAALTEQLSGRVRDA